MNLLDLLFPKRCVGCGRWGGCLCQSCLKEIQPLNFYLCPICERPSMGGTTHVNCQTKYNLNGLVSCFCYKPPLKNLIFKLKYRFLFSLAEELDSLMIKNLKSKFKKGGGAVLRSFLKKKPVVIPVPLHAWRFNWRGFNQASFLAKAVAQEFGLRFCEDLLLRTRFTSPQTFLKRQERKSNVKGVFEVNSKYSLNILISQYPNILLVDDVWTTGATIKTCANLLKRKGAKEVWALTLVR